MPCAKEPILPKYRCLWNWNHKSQPLQGKWIYKNVPLNTPLMEFTFQKSFYSQWGFNIPAHESAVNSKHMGHGAEAKAASWSAPSQCHEWGKMANYAHKIMCYIHSLSSQLSNFHKHHAIGLVALATGSTCPAHTFLHQTHKWIKYKFTNQHWFLLHSFDKLLRTTNQKTAFHFHSKVKVPHFI